MVFPTLKNMLSKMFCLMLMLNASFVYASNIDTDPFFAHSAEDCFKRHVNLKYELINRRIDLFENGDRQDGCNLCSLSCALTCCLPCTLLGILCYPFGKKKLTEKRLRTIIKDDLRGLRNFINGEEVEFKMQKTRIMDQRLISTLQEDFDVYIKSLVDKVSYKDEIKLFQSEHNWKSFLFDSEQKDEDLPVAKAMVVGV
ncbi:MAG: hypothetical protein HRU09_12685 [Oligoflexales bacterium]|nr:hypothetical protein [Oligoflexales bacterium]